MADHAARSAKSVEDASGQIKTNKDDIALLKEDLNYYQKSTKNILDLSRIAVGKTINNNGTLSDSNNDSETTVNFLHVEENTSYVCSVDGVISNMLVVAFYSDDIETSFIGRVTNVETFTTPTNTNYIRVSNNAKNNNKIVGFLEKSQIEKGTSATEYSFPFELNNKLVDWNKINNAHIKTKDLNITLRELFELKKVGKIKNGYYTEESVWVDNTSITTIEYDITDNELLYFTGKVLGSAKYGYIIFWNNETILKIVGRSSGIAQNFDHFEIAPIDGANKITVSAFTNDGSKIFLQKYARRSIPKIVSKDFAGHLSTSEIETEHVFIPCYGQSLSNGSDSLYISDTAVEGNYTIGSIDNPSTGELMPLVLSKNGEHPIVSAINSFSTLFRKYIGDAKFVCGSYGTGGQSIAQLMSAKRQAEIKAEENYNYNISSSGRYSVFEEAVNKVAEKCPSVSCPAIIFLQGERDYFSDESLSTQPGSVVAAYACGGDKEKYKSYMLRLKEDMQKKIMQSFNQKEKPLFCIYEVSGAFVKNTAMTINMAQIEFANENDDVVLLPSPYFTPNYNSGHLSTNGYRWYGEYIAKTLFKTVCQHTQNTPMLPIGFRIDTDNSINIKVGNVVNGLTIDTWTVEKASAYGFRVTLDDTETTLTGVSVYGDEIKIYCTDNPRNAKKVEISYAGMEKGGTGNIRDNDGYVSMYTYWDDTSDTGSSGKLTVTHRPTDINGNNIVGKKYPMQNWLQNFYYKIKG